MKDIIVAVVDIQNVLLSFGLSTEVKRKISTAAILLHIGSVTKLR
jgi:hypothetical protein